MLKAFTRSISKLGHSEETKDDVVAHFTRKEISDFCLLDLEVMETLGTGTFGRVRLVRHLFSGDYYALKISKKSSIIRMKQVEHVKNEVSLLSMIAHPGIVNIFGHFLDDTRLYIVMEYVEGGELFSHLRSCVRFPDHQGKLYAAEIVLVFSYLHSLNVVYRDLKPESKGHGRSVDWWALGVLIHEMLAGFPPFYDENPISIYQKILACRLDIPRHVDSKAKDIIKRLLTIDRTNRLGCIKGGAQTIKVHKWFAGMDWEAVFHGQVEPPFLPKVDGIGDTSNFERYPESVEDDSPPLSADESALFEDFDNF